MKLRLPHPMVLLLGGVLVAALLTWVLPAGEYQRQADPETGRQVVIPGTYRTVERAPVSILAAAVAVPRGIVDGAEVVVVILMVGGAFALLDRTGALRRLVGALVGGPRNPRAVVVMVSLMFATLGALENMHEEIVALIPVLLLLSRGLGFGAVTALAMSVGAAVVGSAMGPTNPFVTGIALTYADLPPMSMVGLRFVLFMAATAVWIGWTLWQGSADDVRPDLQPLPSARVTGRDGLLLALVLVPFIPYVYGVLQLDWGFNELSALFLVAGIAVGLTAGLGVPGTTAGLLQGMEGMLAPALFVGVARGISVVLTDGRVIDTIVHGLVTPLESLPTLVAAGLMVPVHALLHIPVPSNSGQAVLTMPIMAPMADLLGLSRQVAVLAYQSGGAVMDMLTPTNGALLAMLLAAGVPYGRWLRFAIPGALLVAAVGLVGIALVI